MNFRQTSAEYSISSATHRPRHPMAGYTLVELVITVLVLSILSTLAVRSYLKSVRVANRTDAISTITTYSQQLERCYSQTFVYQVYGGTCNTAPPASANSPKGYYAITVNVATPIDPVTAGQVDQYLITATAKSGTIQYNDTNCRTFYLTSLGGQFSANSSGAISTSTGGVSGCWTNN
jgi:type IV pilus assembly protein PilE